MTILEQINMKTRQPMRLTLLLEDANDFRKGLEYIKNLEGLKNDAMEFGMEAGDKQQASDWFKDGVGEWLGELGDIADSIDDLAKQTFPSYSEDGEGEGTKEAVPNDEIPVDTTQDVETQRDQFNDQLDEFEEDMGDFEDKLEKEFKANPPPDDDAKAWNKTLETFNKYFDFLIGRLYRKIGEYAVKKKREDIVQLASKNVTTLKKWKQQLQDSMEDAWNEVIKTPEGRTDNKQQLITIGSFKPVIDIYKQAIKDLASVIKTVKSDPLKELNAEKLTEGLRKQSQMLFENYCGRVSNQVILLGE